MLSFVIPALNERDNIAACIKAIRRDAAAVGLRGEIIVVDNGSTDDTVAQAQAAGADLVVTESRRGTNWARQAGFDRASGKLVAFIDADSIVQPGYVLRALSRFMVEPELACLGGRVIYTDPRWLRMASKPFWLAVKAVNAVTPTMQGANFVVRRNALQQAGGFDTSITFYGDDTDTARSLARVGRVKIDLALDVRSSSRRFRRQGYLKTLSRYWLTGFVGTYLKGWRADDAGSVPVGPAHRQ